MRTYTETHPHINFSLDLREAGHKLWMLLGEACSKADHLIGIPLLPAFAMDFYTLFLVKGVVATTQIEGNSLTEDQVRQLIEGTLDLPPSKEYLGQEVRNIVQGCHLIGKAVFRGRRATVKPNDIKRYNALVLKDLPLPEHVEPGKIRTYDVGVGHYRGAPPEDCEHLLEKMCDLLNIDFDALDLPKSALGILKAIVAHIYIAWIHPFGDGNGRTARLIEFQVLLAAGIPSTAAHLFSNHYNLTRAEYYRQLDKASSSGGDILPFLEYALQGFVDGLQEQINSVKGQQLLVHWINFIHDTFRDKDSKTDIRRRRLVIDMSDDLDPVPLSKIRYISPRIAESYANKTDKTVQRDLVILQAMKLVTKTRGGYIVCIDLMKAFMPRLHDNEHLAMDGQMELDLDG